MRKALLVLLSLLFIAHIVVAAETGSEQTQLTKEDAVKILQGIQGEVKSVTPAEIPGIYQVNMQMQGKLYPLYLDASGSYLFSGNIIRIKDRVNLTEEAFKDLNPVDVSAIPLGDALSLGGATSKDSIIVFTDPHCPYCSKLHKVLLDAVEQDPTLSFKIKIAPFKQTSKEISRTIICNQSMEQLELAFAGKSLPEPTCQTDVPEKNVQLAQQLGIRGTPTMIMPNGKIVPGYRPLESLLDEIKANR